MTAGNDFDPSDDLRASNVETGDLEADDAGAEPKLFSALLTPHRSLNRTGFIVLMSFVTVVSFIAGVVFWWLGAWPIFGFFWLDVLVIYWAFKVNFRTARASEEITVTPSELRVRRISHRGHVAEWVLNPLWVRFEQISHEEFGIERLYLVSRGRRISIGSFLSPMKRLAFPKP